MKQFQNMGDCYEANTVETVVLGIFPPLEPGRGFSHGPERRQSGPRAGASGSFHCNGASYYL